MEIFTKLFGNLLAFVYHCFDRIVIHGYLRALSRPEQVVHFFRQVLGIPVVVLPARPGLNKTHGPRRSTGEPGLMQKCL